MVRARARETEKIMGTGEKVLAEPEEVKKKF